MHRINVGEKEDRTRYCIIFIHRSGQLELGAGQGSMKVMRSDEIALRFLLSNHCFNMEHECGCYVAVVMDRSH